MNFVTIDYAIFLPIVFGLSALWSGRFVLAVFTIAGGIFYAWWNPWLLMLILACAVNSYIGGLAVERWRSRGTLAVFITIDVSILFFFKYYGWFERSTTTAFGTIGLPFAFPHLELLLPIGISFHIFESIGYMVDVYRGTIRAERSFATMWLFLMFFPKLVAGPIERAGNLIPQLKAMPHGWLARSDLPGGLFLIFKGVVLKLVIADNMAFLVNQVYGNLTTATPWDTVLASYAFSIQIYCDFYGYTLIALGSAAIFGVRLTNNFDHPYFASNIQDFWRRWHISLSNWFRDYVYIPLGGNRVSPVRNAFNLTVLMLLVGVWHGANYTFVIWGIAHGAMLSLHRLYRLTLGRHVSRVAVGPLSYLSTALGFLVTFHLVTLAWVFFRAPDLATAWQVFGKIGTALSGAPWASQSPVTLLTFYLSLACFFVAFEMIDRTVDLRQRFVAAPGLVQAAAMFLLLASTYLGANDDVQFIYFQF